MRKLVIETAELARRLSVPKETLRVEVYQEGQKAGDAVRVDVFVRGRDLSPEETRITQAYLFELGLRVMPVAGEA